MRHPTVRAFERRLFGYVFCLAVGASAVAGCRKADSHAEPAPAVATSNALPAAATSSASSATPDALLAVGQPVPDLERVAQDGRKVSLRSFAGTPLVVYFYPKDETTGCTIEAEGIRDAWKDLSATGAVVIGVSADDDTSHKSFTQHHQLPFMLLADTDNSIAHAFGVPVKGGKDQRVTFVVGKDGKISKVFPAVDPHGHAAEILAAIQRS